MSTADAIKAVCSEVEQMLLAKNAAYGDSAVNPLRVFSKVDSVEQLNVRIDDKLSRIARGHAAGEDAEWDLIGYLILKRAAIRKIDEKATQPRPSPSPCLATPSQEPAPLAAHPEC